MNHVRMRLAAVGTAAAVAAAGDVRTGHFGYLAPTIINAPGIGQGDIVPTP